MCKRCLENLANVSPKRLAYLREQVPAMQKLAKEVGETLAKELDFLVIHEGASAEDIDEANRVTGYMGLVAALAFAVEQECHNEHTGSDLSVIAHHSSVAGFWNKGAEEYKKVIN